MSSLPNDSRLRAAEDRLRDLRRRTTGNPNPPPAPPGLATLVDTPVSGFNVPGVTVSAGYYPPDAPQYAPTPAPLAAVPATLPTARTLTQGQAIPPQEGAQLGQTIKDLGEGGKKAAQGYGSAAVQRIRQVWAKQWQDFLNSPAANTPEYQKFKDLVAKGFINLEQVVEQLGDPTKARFQPPNIQAITDKALEAQAPVLPQVEKYSQAVLEQAEKKFAAEYAKALGKVSSTASNYAQHTGIAGATTLAGAQGAELEHLAPAAHEKALAPIRSEVDNFIRASLEGAAQQAMQAAGNTTASKLDMERKSVELLADEVSKALQKGQLKAGAETEKLMNAINEWKAILAKGQQATHEKNTVLRLLLGALSVVGGTAVALGTAGTGVGAVAGGGMIASGLGALSGR